MSHYEERVLRGAVGKRFGGAALSFHRVSRRLQSTRMSRQSLSMGKPETERLKNRFTDIAIFAATRENDNILILRR